MSFNTCDNLVGAIGLSSIDPNTLVMCWNTLEILYDKYILRKYYDMCKSLNLCIMCHFDMVSRASKKNVVAKDREVDRKLKIL